MSGSIWGPTASSGKRALSMKYMMISSEIELLIPDCHRGQPRSDTFGEAELQKEPNIHRQKNGGENTIFAVDQSMAFLSWVTVHCQPTANHRHTFLINNQGNLFEQLSTEGFISNRRFFYSQSMLDVFPTPSWQRCWTWLLKEIRPGQSHLQYKSTKIRITS